SFQSVTREKLCQFSIGVDSEANLATYLRFYNERRLHRSLDGQTPDATYVAALAAASRPAA
ncbi:MAG: integrase core domain-containing protein, partial [Candidatus Accumulibacter sp.]